ncbi:MAG: PAS domain S-box protein [bacterium]
MERETPPKPWDSDAERRLFLTLVENSLVGIYLFQHDRIIYLNPTFEKILGRDAAQIYSSDIFEFIHPEDREMVRSKARERLAGTLSPEPYSFRILNPKEGVRWVVLLAHRIMYRGEAALLGNVTDVTEVIRSQQELQRTNALLEGLFAAMPDAAAILDQEGRITRINQAFQSLFGYSQQEAVGRLMWELIEPEDRTGEGFQNQRRVLAGEIVCLETQRRKKDGSILDVVITGYPIRSGDEIYGIYAIYKDVTAQKMAQRSLEEAETRYMELVEQVPAGVYEIDVETARFLTINNYMIRVFGYSREEFLSMTGYDLWTDEGKEILRQRISRLLQGQEVPHVVEYPGRTKDGKEIWARVYSHFSRNREGKLVARVVLLDVTEQRRLEQELLQAQKMEAVGRLAGGVAHEINNALTSVLAYADLIFLSTKAGEPFHDEAREIKEGAMRAASITSQLLAFSRKQIIRPQVMDLNSLIRNFTRMLAPLLGENIWLSTRLFPRPLWIKIDPNQMEQIILNLAINARDAMPKGGKLFLETDIAHLDESYGRDHGISLTPGPYVRLSVTDTGVGMDPKTLERIFEPFFTTKEVGKGTGLGLSTVYGIVRQNHGYIWAYSEPGQGTTFKIYLPMEAEDIAVLDREPWAASEAVLSGSETVLVVEDSAPVRKLVRTILERHGYKVLEAASGEAALSLLQERKSKVDLVLTDVVLPGMAGPEMAQKAREMIPGLKFIYMSGYTGEFMEEKGVLEKGLDIIEKPFSPEALVYKVRRILDG